jgi:hypothetical protein
MECWYEIKVVLGPGVILDSMDGVVVPAGGRLMKFKASLLRGNLKNGYTGTADHTVLSDTEKMIYVLFDPVDIDIGRMLPAPNDIDPDWHMVTIFPLIGGHVLVTTT